MSPAMQPIGCIVIVSYKTTVLAVPTEQRAADSTTDWAPFLKVPAFRPFHFFAERDD
jgi:hypothetical protein